MHQQYCFFHTDPRGIPTVPPRFAMFISPIKGTYLERVNGSQQELRAFPGNPIEGFGRGYPPSFVANMIMAQQQSSAERNEQNTRQSRSPSVDSVSRLHQQSGGFATHNQQPNQQSSQHQQQPSEQRRGSYSKDGNGGYYQQNQSNGGYRRQNFGPRGNRGNNQRSSNNYQQSGEYTNNNFQQGYQQKQRNYQNYTQHQPKNSFFHQRPMFNSSQELGSYSVRRPSPSSPSPSSPIPSTGIPTSNRSSVPAPILLRHVDPSFNEKTISGTGNEEQHHDAKIHQYRSAGTAPGGYSNSSSPYKQPPPQPPSTPSSSDKKDADDWSSRFQHPPPGLHSQYRRSQHENIPAPIELQRKNPVPSTPIEINPSSQPTTPSPLERTAQIRAALKDPHSVDSVDAKHPCFADERLHSALYGVSPQVKSQNHPPGVPIQTAHEASKNMENLKSLQFQQISLPHNIYHINAYMPYPAFDPRVVKNRENQYFQQHVNLQRASSFHDELLTRKEPRDSSNDSRSSIEAIPNSMDKIMDQLDDEVTGADLDKTPVNKGPTQVKTRNDLTVRKSENSKAEELPRRMKRRDSTSSTVSTTSGPCSPALDESTLTKILPSDEFRGGRGVASPSPPVELLSEPLSRMDVLSEKIWDYHNKVSQTDEMLQRKLHLRDMLYTAISPVFPLSGLYVVGSSLNGFGNNSSDMDLCLMITNKDLDQKNDAVVVLNLILSTLQYEKFVASQKLILAKVPILRINFAAPFDDITVDLNANNSVAIRNTHLLCYYSSYDWRVRPLVSVVKEWAKRKGINDANKSSFTSYSLVLMVIHYLQCGATAKVLPNLQQSYPSRFSNKVDVRTLNVTMPLESVHDDVDPALSEKTTLGELLIGFLAYYANEFNYDRDAISIRQGRRVERAALAARPKMHLNSEGDKETPPPSSSASSSSLHNAVGTGAPMHHSMSNPHFWRSQWRCVCIEEPFTNSNTAHSIYDEMVFGAIKEAFREAHGELQHNHDLDRLLECDPIKASITNAGAAVYAATYEGERPPAQQPTSVASASLRAMNSIPVNHGGGHYHYQQQSHQQVSKQQRPGSNQGFQLSNHRGTNGNNQQCQQNRRSYNNQSSFNAGNSSRSSRSIENFKELSSPQPLQQSHRQPAKNGTGTLKENLAAAIGVAGSVEKKQYLTAKKEEGNKAKRSALVQSPEPSNSDVEKVLVSPTEAI